MSIALLGVVEIDRGDFARCDLAVHRADIAERLTVGRLVEAGRPVAEERRGRGVVEDLLRLVRDFLDGAAPDFSLFYVDLCDRNEKILNPRGPGKTKKAGSPEGIRPVGMAA
jgi:hypothetical protein